MRSPILLFESDAFPVLRGEDEETNPGLFGESLANWVAERLQHKGLPTQGVIAEDFGWCVVIPQPPHRVLVACCLVGGSPTRWSAFAFIEGGLVARLFGVGERERRLSSLYAVLKSCLQESPEIQGLREEPDGK